MAESTTLVFSHPACAVHNMGEGHPEQPARLEAALRAARAVKGVELREAPRAGKAQILRIHPETYYDALVAAEPEQGTVRLDPDTAMGPGSMEAALRAAGAVCAAVDAVCGGEAGNAFCVVRPPGHHAEPDRAMGFCLLNNVAIGAAQARMHEGIGRVAVIDFDVHHGNGTQAAFEADPDLVYFSTHQDYLYPGTGRPEERGVGNIYNYLLPPGCDSGLFRRVVSEGLLPALREAAPDLVMVSAGFDAHRLDPLAQVNLETEDYGWITRELRLVADECAGGRLVSVLEGGYLLDVLHDCVKAHLNELRATD